jgi:hypothetical protein
LISSWDRLRQLIHQAIEGSRLRFLLRHRVLCGTRLRLGWPGLANGARMRVPRRDPNVTGSVVILR